MNGWDFIAVLLETHAAHSFYARAYIQQAPVTVVVCIVDGKEKVFFYMDFSRSLHGVVVVLEMLTLYVMQSSMGEDQGLLMNYHLFLLQFKQKMMTKVTVLYLMDQIWHIDLNYIHKFEIINKV